MKLISITRKNTYKVLNLLGIKIKIPSYSARLQTIEKLIANVRTQIADRQVFHYQIINRIKEQELREKIRRGGKVKVFFLIAQPSKFGMETIYEGMLASELFDPCIYSVYYDKNKQLDGILRQQCDTNFDYWRRKGYRVLNGFDEEYKPVPLYERKPDIVFISDPVLFGFSSFKNHIFNWHYLTCYVPYGLSIMEDSAYHFNFVPINEMWKVFCQTRYDYEQFINCSRHFGLNAVYYGYPEFDSYARPIEEGNIPDKINNGKPIVIYAPHWSIKDPKRNNISTFHLYWKYFLSLLEKYPDINFVFKPHPRLLPRLYDLIDDKTIMKPEAYHEYVRQWNEAPNGFVMGEGDYIDLFRKSVVLITDCGSFIGEYLYTHNPCIYLVNPNLFHFGKIKNNFLEKYSLYGQEILTTYYICHSEKEIQKNFENVVIKKIDNKKELREQVMKKYSEYIGNAGQRIVEHLTRALKD